MNRCEISTAQIAYLDFLRGAGAIMVLLGHAAHRFLPETWLANEAVRALGVYIFFLISGFLIALSVLQKLNSPSYRFTDYFCDRFFRIYAAFVPALIFVAILDAAIVHSAEYEWRRDFNVQTWLGNLLMLQDYPIFQALRRLGVHDQAWMIAPFGSARAFWTISIEWWLYLTFGAIMFFVVRRGSEIGALGLVALLLVAVEPLYHVVGGHGQCLTLLWAVGAGAALFFHRLPSLRARFPRFSEARVRAIGGTVAAAGLVFMAARVAANPRLVGAPGAIYELQFGLFLAMLVFGALFFLAGRPHHAGVAGPTAFLAGYSYSLYLIHSTILEVVWVERPDLVGSHVAFWALILLCNLAAIAFWWAFERHHRQMAKAARAWLARRRSEALTA
jgi:peptidoglycan/LPS O-acetylase OafA/YrhL